MSNKPSIKILCKELEYLKHQYAGKIEALINSHIKYIDSFKKSLPRQVINNSRGYKQREYYQKLQYMKEKL